MTMSAAPAGANWAQLCRDYREARGLKQEAMAQDFHVSQSSVSRWEQGRRRPPLRIRKLLLDDRAARQDRAQSDLDQALLFVLDGRGRMRSCNAGLTRAMARIRAVTDVSAAGLGRYLRSRPLFRSAFSTLQHAGAFHGSLLQGTLISGPVWDRPKHRGLLTLNASPTALTDGAPGLLLVASYHPHRPAQPAPALFSMAIQSPGRLQHHALV